MRRIVLHYFDMYARAETSRMILNYIGVPFHDLRYDINTEWPEIKNDEKFEIGKLPCLEIDGKILIQSGSIERFLCREFGMYPKDNYSIYLTESLRDIKEDFFNNRLKYLMVLKDREGWEKYSEEELPKILKAIEKRYIANGNKNFFIGSTPTLGDFAIFFMVHDFMIRKKANKRMSELLVSSAPKLIDFAENFKNSSPFFLDYMQNREDLPY